MYLKLKKGYTLEVLKDDNYITVDGIEMFLGRIKLKRTKLTQIRRNYNNQDLYEDGSILNGYDVISGPYGHNNCDIVYLEVKKQEPEPQQPPPPPPPPPPPESEQPTPKKLSREDAIRTLNLLVIRIVGLNPSIKDTKHYNYYTKNIQPLLKIVPKIVTKDIDHILSLITSLDIKLTNYYAIKQGGYRATRKRSKLTQRRRRYSRRHATS